MRPGSLQPHLETCFVIRSKIVNHHPIILRTGNVAGRISGECEGENEKSQAALRFIHRINPYTAPAIATGVSAIVTFSIGVSQTGHSRNRVDGHSHPGYSPCEK